MQSTHGRSSGLGLALLSAVAFGGSGVAAKPLIEAGFEPLHVVWMRMAGAALVLLPVALHHRELPRRRPGLLIGFGLLGIAGCQGLYFLAIARIPVGVAILVEYLGPALLLGWVRFVQRRRVRLAAVFGMVLAVGGMCCVVEIWSGLAFAPTGLLCAFGAACCQVAYFLLADHGTQDGLRRAPPPRDVRPAWDTDEDRSSHARAAARGSTGYGSGDDGFEGSGGFEGNSGFEGDEGYDAEDGYGTEAGGAPDPVAVIAYGLLVGTASLTLVAHPWDIAWTSLAHQVPLGDRDVPAILLVGWIVLVSTVVSYLTGVIAVRRLSPQIAAVISCVEAVVGTVLAWFLLDEHLGVPELAGGALILAGAYAAQRAAPGAADDPAQAVVPAVPKPRPESDFAGTP